MMMSHMIEPHCLIRGCDTSHSFPRIFAAP
jgi:hypothetical protein